MGAPLTPAQAAHYGRKILKVGENVFNGCRDSDIEFQAVGTLYRFGFPPIGHIQAGNIFVDGNVCQVGGYENTLLGYKTRLHRSIANENCLDDIDIIMFGEWVWPYEWTRLPCLVSQVM